MADNYKSTYTKEEADALVKWIDEVQPKGEINLGKGVYIKDLEKFSKQVRHVCVEYYNNTTFSGQISLMMDVRDRYGK